MPETDLNLLIRAAEAAAEAVRPYVRTELDVTHKADGAGPVTEADHAANARIEEILRGQRPDYGWLSEESPDTPARLGTDRTFVVDPIDGTRSFIEGSNTWAHSIAVVEHGIPVAGVVYLPMRHKLYSAQTGGGAWLNGAAIHASATTGLDLAEVLAPKPAMDTRHWARAVPSIKRSHRPSLAYRMCLVAEGRYDAMLTFRPAWEWDIAAGALILQEAGALATDMTGQTLRFNASHPQSKGVVAAPPVLHADILSRMAHVADA